MKITSRWTKGEGRLSQADTDALVENANIETLDFLHDTIFELHTLYQKLGTVVFQLERDRLENLERKGR